ncbi:14-3-3 protein [Trichomonas vaginalis G3]|uniref:14-3-3 protein n=1 Tax=Trichomonas vaginalis (strain ATCC PRA-98 / G3) TaxID=412133 RepID=A2F1A4_TRIV3|nr:protein domain specific binding [Trichomonas vaginalis G3]EAY01333.1 14-3-3 protein [Trichomonas vaginalis G3]KAI5506807.1 protein domain specific binding [Trichomonas vaginalis G3]|eukprot:XP_001330191.1 14-3-3 protein [Trichomonas vaginalis G3]
MSERDQCVTMAQILGQTPSKAKEMVNYMKRAVELNPILDTSERTLLSVGYKNLITSRRQGIRHLMQQEDEMEGLTVPCKERIQKIKEELINELVGFCTELINLVDEVILPKVEDPESVVFYQKLKADFYRYICEAQTGHDLELSLENATKSYKKALEVSKQNLQSYSPTSLGLILNYTVFLFENAKKQTDAVRIAQETYQTYAPIIEQNSEKSREEAAQIIKLLDENIKLWESSLEETDSEPVNE